jgi:putative endonuclease
LHSERKKCRVGQPVKTPPFHGGITGSIPVHGTRLHETPLKFERRFCVNILVMITVYYLKSILDATTYVGRAKDPIACLKEHNADKNKYTKGHMPWEILYKETFPDLASARVREKYFKTAAGKKWLQNKLKEMEE